MRLAPTTVALHFEVILVEGGGKIIIVFAALDRELDELGLAAEGRIFATAFFEGLPITRIDVLTEDCVDVGELLPFEEDIGALVPGFDAVVLYLRVLRVEDVVLLAEGFGAQKMVGTRR